MKSLALSFLLMFSLTGFAADSTIGNLTPITTVPDTYRMPWENPGVLDYYITFANLTNQILTDIASKAYAQGLTNGYVYASVTNGLAPIAYVDAATNGFIRSTSLSGYAQLAGTNVFTRTNTFQADALGTTITPIMWLTNGTAAALGAQQASPALMLGGQGFRSGNSTTMPVQMGLYNLPVQGSSANPVGKLVFMYSVSNSVPTAIPGDGNPTSVDSAGNWVMGPISCWSLTTKGASVACAANNSLGWTSGSSMFSTANGTIALSTGAINTPSSFSMLVLGNTNSSWPAIKVENSTNNPSISFRTGNDSNYVSIVASNITATGNITLSTPRWVDSAFQWFYGALGPTAPDATAVTNGSAILGLGFTAAAEGTQKLYGSAQINHNIAPSNATLYTEFHLHVSPTTSPAAGSSNIAFTVIYDFNNIGTSNRYGPITNTCQIGLTSHTFNNLMEFGHLAFTNFYPSISSISRCTIYRSASTSNDYSGIVILDSADWHYPVDRFGSANDASP